MSSSWCDWVSAGVSDSDAVAKRRKIGGDAKAPSAPSSSSWYPDFPSIPSVSDARASIGELEVSKTMGSLTEIAGGYAQGVADAVTGTGAKGEAGSSQEACQLRHIDPRFDPDAGIVSKGIAFWVHSNDGPLENFKDCVRDGVYHGITETGDYIAGKGNKVKNSIHDAVTGTAGKTAAAGGAVATAIAAPVMACAAGGAAVGAATAAVIANNETLSENPLAAGAVGVGVGVAGGLALVAVGVGAIATVAAVGGAAVGGLATTGICNMMNPESEDAAVSACASRAFARGWNA